MRINKIVVFFIIILFVNICFSGYEISNLEKENDEILKYNNYLLDKNKNLIEQYKLINYNYSKLKYKYIILEKANKELCMDINHKNKMIKNLNRSNYHYRILLEIKNNRIKYLESIEDDSNKYKLRKSISKEEFKKLLDNYNDCIYWDWTCYNYAYNMVEYFRNNGIYASTVTVTFPNYRGHMLVAVNVSGNITYIEPQSCRIVKLEIGKDYFNINGFYHPNINGTILKYDDMFEHEYRN